MKINEILTALLVITTLLSANAQSGTLLWHDIESKANITSIYTSAADNNSVYYMKIVGLLKPKEFKLIKADYNFKDQADIDLLASRSGLKVASSISVLDAKNGKILGLETTTGYVKGQFPISLKFGLLDANLKMTSELHSLKMAPDAVIPANIMEMSGNADNKYFMTLNQNDQFVYCYLHCSDQEENLQVGIARFDADYNLVSNDLVEIAMQANRVIDARLAADSNFDSYYLLLKETSTKNPRKDIELNSNYGRSVLPTPNEEAIELSTVYRIHDGKVAGSSALTDYVSQTPDIQILNNGRVLVVGLESGKKYHAFNGLYNYIFNSTLTESTTSTLPFAKIASAEFDRFTQKDKTLKMRVRHLELLRTESNYVVHFELNGDEDYMDRSGSNSASGYATIVSYDDFFTQLDADGKFTTLTALVPKEQSESTLGERYGRSLIYVVGNTINVLFNDTPENLKANKKLERWDYRKMKKEDTIVRKIVIDKDMKTVSNEVVSPKGSLAIMPNTSWSDSERTVIFATDNETTYGTVIVH